MLNYSWKKSIVKTKKKRSFAIMNVVILVKHNHIEPDELWQS